MISDDFKIEIDVKGKSGFPLISDLTGGFNLRMPKNAINGKLLSMDILRIGEDIAGKATSKHNGGAFILKGGEWLCRKWVKTKSKQPRKICIWVKES